MSLTIGIIACLLSLILGGSAGVLIFKAVDKKKATTAKTKAAKIIEDAYSEAKSVRKETVLEAKEEAQKIKDDLDREIKERRAEIQKLEERLISREENIIKKEELLDSKQTNLEAYKESLTQKENAITDKEQELENKMQNCDKELERISGLTKDDAKKEIITKYEDEAKLEAVKYVKEIEQTAKDEADKKAKDIVTLAIQKCAVDQAQEITISTVSIPNEDIKGRIIGREGRNIRAIEQATGIEVIIDDTPDMITLSSFDPIRREIARIAIEKLIMDGRIHPTRIEELVDKAKRGGLLHDIGKAVDFEQEGTHVTIGVELARKYKENEAVVHCIEAHHFDVPFHSVEAVIVQIADAISASRPGARRENLENYIKRLHDLEDICKAKTGVDKCYAISAGREVRVIVKPEQVTDADAVFMAKDIAKEIEAKLQYPGQIKVNVIRETRATELAK